MLIDQQLLPCTINSWVGVADMLLSLYILTNLLTDYFKFCMALRPLCIKGVKKILVLTDLDLLLEEENVRNEFLIIPVKL